mmetsp:Transcript_27534/g.50432  ORF Transcript_27534/g.50432 Transcript_27534/m.50432 type:complete len:197 (-) Transcript_27534:82-672(-)
MATDADVADFRIDCSNWRSKDDFYDGLLSAVNGMPGHGRNLDALNDMLRGGTSDLNPPFRLTFQRYDSSGGEAKELIQQFIAIAEEEEVRATGVIVKTETGERGAFTIDCSAWRTKDDFYDGLLSGVNAMPEHGRNLDALSDMLTGGTSDLEPPFTLTFQGYDSCDGEAKGLIQELIGIAEEEDNREAGVVVETKA